MMKIEVFKLNKEATIPTRTTKFDAGVDLYCIEDTFIPVNQTRKVPTGIAIRIAPGFVGKVANRSSMSVKGLDVGAGIVDPGFSGEICVVLHNLNNDANNETGRPGYWVKKGDKVAQMLIMPISTPDVVETHNLWISERGNKGFGSSGV